MTGLQHRGPHPSGAAHPAAALPVPEDVYSSWSPTASPDGSQVAFVSDRSGEPRVWLAELLDGRLGRWAPLGADFGRVDMVSWSPDGKWLACSVAAHGRSRSEAWIVRPDGSGLRMVGGRDATNATVGTGRGHAWVEDGRLLVTETGRTSRAMLVDPFTGEQEVVAEGPLLTLLDVDRSGRRALLRRGPRGARSLFVVDRRDGVELPVVPGEREGSTDAGVLSADGSVVYARTDAGRELVALVAVPLDGGAPRLVAGRHDADLADIALSPDGRSIALVWNVLGGRSALSTLDLETGVQRQLDPLPREVIDDVRFTPDGSRLLLTAEGWADPRGVWALDPSTREAVPLSSDGGRVLLSSPAATTHSVDVGTLAAPQLRWLLSGDGTPVTGWLYRPAHAGPWPTMIHLHGGPEAQERPVYNSLFQSLVAAGVAVFAPNVRGSSGFGRTFVHADDLDRRYGAIEDVAACAAYLTEAGIAPAGKVGVMGRSYGGYLTLAALVSDPELYAVGVDVCGMSDFATFYEHTEPYIAAAAVSKYGHPERDRELLRDLSPMTRIDRLRAPLLVVHGAEDTNVPVVEADQVVAALQERGVEVRYWRVEGEGHVLLATPNRVRFVQETVEWVCRHLGVAR
ncbi:S9 family peptidase [Motilibacter deserti]|uniref:S9 family peptidase n=1 Tax=Motilibacter deserti TaxID=2714956 RepID=A0ABX0GVC0_9ACTN|nr:S9 family peptidase [Motilibacter deserti]NHC14892.1 S9 family peptidase [Motilibacter deserti]